MMDPHRESVLIVEDDEGVAYLQGQALQRAGYNVTSVATEGEALQHLSANPTDLIILDYRLSYERTGLDLYADLKTAGFQLPAIMVTGFGDEAIVIKALRAGVRDFISKSSEYLDYLPQAVESALSHRRLENRLAESDKRLRQAQKLEAIGTLAGGVAHEFNNLLQVIQGYTRFAMEGLEADRERFNDLEQVLIASDRAVSLTRQLLGFSRREVLQMTEIQPNELVRDLVNMIRPLIGEHIAIELHLDDKVGSIHADASHIEQMLMNLCVNARDAMPDGGKLSIKSENVTLMDEYCDYNGDIQPGRYILLAVADTGCGMPADVVSHIFEPFYTTKGIGKGTGLGLAQVYGVVQQHKGAIRVYSEPGMGTMFRIYLPTIDHAAPVVGSTSRTLARGGSETILVAEDEPLVRDLTIRMLRRAGYETIAAADGEEAVRLFEQHRDRVSLALLDVVMPKLGGRDVFEKIKEIEPAMRVVFCSGYDPDMTQVGFVLDDAHPLVQKPFDPHVLLGTIREMLDGVCAPG